MCADGLYETLFNKGPIASSVMVDAIRPAAGERFWQLRDDQKESVALGVLSGFVNEGVDSFQSLFSVQGAAFAAGITILSARLPRLAKFGLYAGVVSGLWNITSGAITLIRGDEATAEEAAERMGRGLFYALPLFQSLSVKIPSFLLRRSAVRQLKGVGVVAEDDGLLQAAAAGIVEGPMKRMLEPLPPSVRRRVSKAMNKPTFSTEYDFLLTETYLPLSVHVSYHHKNPRWRPLQPLTEVILKLDQLHEGRHLRAGYENYPDLWRYCIERRMKDSVPYPGDLLRQFFARHSEKFPTVREALQTLWRRDRKKLWQLCDFLGLKRVRPEERLCFAEEYRAIREHLSHIDWVGTFERYKDLYYSQRGETSWVQRYKDWRIFRQLRRSIEANLIVPLAVSESRFLRYRTRAAYDHFNFYIYSEMDLANGLYLYFCLNDRGVRVPWN